ncbi:hypothetical protein ABID58_003163 [Bradyrhizobium sp. S3.2.6]|uniref:Uncharacterized protein n=1 Tax=Bradyrhizobium cytisi TaxID=515489 RepID=A0A5S4WVZ6_9BRAD|nr:hypothetical protein [Bradyrhizobium cytisi]TYL84829.1 hypothetical protein FXB38_14295 [Bradyrhizobium cytisi]
MSQITDQLANIGPSAIPTEAEREVWATLSRDEQVRRYQKLFAQPNCNNFTSETPDDILATARQRVAQRGHG